VVVVTTLDRVKQYADQLLVCLGDQFNLLPAAIRPGNYEHVAGTLFVEDIDPFFGADKCCEGTGWVRVGETYPSRNFPDPDPFDSGSCDPQGWAQVIDVGVARCYPGYGSPSGPTAAQHLAARDQDLIDLMTLKKAICCWAAVMVPKRNNYQITGIAVTGPSGACISRIASLLVQVGRCDC
jgi:hypothetical protein